MPSVLRRNAMKILISGACGFVGSALAGYLRSAMAGSEIIGIDNFIRPGSELNRRTLQERGITIQHADLRVASDFETLPKVDYVIDAAASPGVLGGVDGKTTTRQLVEHNLGGTINLLEYCKAHRAGFILLSTSRVYSIPPLAALPVRVENDAFVPDESRPLPAGVSAQGVDETFSTRPPISLYGTTKLASEGLALEYGAAFEFPVWINRCGVLAGAGQFGRAEQGIFSYWLHAWKHKQPLAYIGFDGAGHQVRDALHPHDLARLVVRQLEFRGVTEQIVNVAGGAGNSLSLRRLSAWCEARWGANKVRSCIEPRPFDLPWLVLDSRRANEAWNWHPEITLDAILEEIAVHAESHPDWLERCAS
jgi:CDP-paratose 2-epimerase